MDCSNTFALLSENKEETIKQFFVMSFCYYVISSKEHIRYSTYIPPFFPELPEDSYLLGVSYKSKDCQMCVTGARKYGHKNLRFFVESAKSSMRRELSEEIGIYPDEGSIDIKGQYGKFTVGLVNINNCKIYEDEGEGEGEDSLMRDISEQRVAVYVYGDLESISKCIQTIRKRRIAEDTSDITGLCIFPVERAKTSYDYCYQRYSNPTSLRSSYSSQSF